MGQTTTVTERAEAIKLLAKEQPQLFRQLIRSYQVTYGALFHRAGQPYPFESLVEDILKVEMRNGLLFSKQATCIKCGKVFGTNVDSKWCSKCEEKERYRSLVHLDIRYGQQGKSSRACIGVRIPLEGKKTTVLSEVECTDCHAAVMSENTRFNILNNQKKKRLLREKLAFVQSQVTERVPKDIRRRQLKEMTREQVIAAGRKAVELMGYEVADDWEPESIEYIISCEARNKTIAAHDFDCYGCGKDCDHSSTKPHKLPLCYKCVPLFFNAECTQEFWLVALDLCMERGVFEEVRRTREDKLKEEAKDASAQAP